MSHSSATHSGDGPSEATKDDPSRTKDSAVEYDGTAYLGSQSKSLNNKEPEKDPSQEHAASEDDSTQDHDRYLDLEDTNSERNESGTVSPLIDGAVLRSTRFPEIEIIEHYRQTRHVDYDYLAQSPQGYYIPEQGWGWFLYKHEWYRIHFRKHFTTVVGRSVLLEMGLESAELPDPVKDEDLEDAKGLPDWPIRMQDYHQLPEHNAEICHWPSMTQDPTDIPVLDRSLDDDLLDMLVVHDPGNIASLRAKSSAEDDAAPEQEDKDAINYVRLDPTGIGIPWVQRPPRNLDPLVGHLHLAIDNQTHFGKNSAVCVASLDLPYAVVKSLFSNCYRAKEGEPVDQRDRTEGDENGLEVVEGDLSANANEIGYRRDDMPTRFKVIAKIAYSKQSSHEIVNNEARVYGRMPKILSEHWSGYQKGPSVTLPQPAEAVVPIPFGYYIPDIRYGRLSNGQRPSETNSHRLNPITLMEHCGDRIDVDMDKLHIEYKEQLYSMLTRLSCAGFAQGCMSQRNWLVQPGPLRAPPSQRSLKRPIFRMIDFGLGLWEGDANEHFDSRVEEDDKLRELMEYDYWTQLEYDWR